MRKLLLMALLAFAFNVHAAFIQTDNYQTDERTGLDWLDLDDTFGQTRAGALFNNEGWRYATNAEVEFMFVGLFSGYADTNSTYHTSTRGGNGPAQFQQTITFQTLFGRTFGYLQFAPDTIWSGYDKYGITQAYGMYEDEDGQTRVLGATKYLQRQTVGCSRYGCYQGNVDYTTVYSTEFATEFLNSYNNASVGTFLVRDGVSAVPIPAAIWLFGTGLMGLVAFARRKDK